MKLAKTVALIMSLLMLSGVFVFAAEAASFPNLPTTSVTIEVTSGAYVFPITIVLSNVPPGYDVSNQAYIGYCANLLTGITPGTLYTATLVSSLTLGTEWNEINYILNNVPAAATSLDIQAAIWFVQAFTAAQVISDAHFTPTALAQTMASNAESFGATFVPGPGQIVAVEIVSSGQTLLIPLTEPPTHQGNVYIPPGPSYDMSEWITPSLRVYNMNNSYAKVGWLYSDGPMYNATSETNYPKIDYDSPLIIGKPTIGFGTTVMVLGFIPGVTASFDATPPPVELTITWDGVPNTVTLTTSKTVGTNVPPTVQPDIPTVYQASYPGKEGGVNINKNAFYNEYVGPFSSVLMAEFGIKSPPAWTYTDYGLWFWYKFTPNTGATMAYDCQGKVSDQPTYDITALLEYGTSQVWFNHICFNVAFLFDHKTVTWEDGGISGNGSALAMDQITIQNVGLVTATGLNLTETFPEEGKVGIIPYGNAYAYLYTTTGALVAGPTKITFPWNQWFQLPSGWNTLAPGYNLTITQEMTVYVMNQTSPVNEELIFSSMVAANEIPAFKDPIGVYPLKIGKPNGSPVELFDGKELVVPTELATEVDSITDLKIDTEIIGCFMTVSEWPVPTPWSGSVPTLPAFSMVLDPAPVSLSGGSTVTFADVSLVREAICGLVPYNPLMDLQAKGYVNLQDLAAYKVAAGC